MFMDGFYRKYLGKIFRWTFETLCINLNDMSSFHTVFIELFVAFIILFLVVFFIRFNCARRYVVPNPMQIVVVNQPCHYELQRPQMYMAIPFE